MKLTNQYHDARLSSVRISGDELTLIADLDGHWNNGCEQRAYLMFHNVKNLDEICATLDIHMADGEFGCTHEIVDIVKTDKTRYLIDLGFERALEIDCRGLSEI